MMKHKKLRPRRRHLFMLLSIIASFYVLSCSDGLQDDLHEQRVNEKIPFGIPDAKEYFEANATDLSFIHFNTMNSSTLSPAEAAGELVPDWKKAVRSENNVACLVEVPLRSTVNLLPEANNFEVGQYLFSASPKIDRRMLIAQAANGKRKMFVVTIIPSVWENAGEESIENFRYLGGGDFTGKVFVSTLEGRFVEASQYVKGRFVRKLRVFTRQELESEGEKWDDFCYESIFFYPKHKRPQHYLFHRR